MPDEPLMRVPARPPQAYYMAVAIMHFPLSLVETTLLSILSYFIAGLSNADGAGNFFYFYFMMIAMAYYGLALARLLAYTMPNNSVGSVFCSGMHAAQQQRCAFLDFVSGGVEARVHFQRAYARTDV
jgi:hypothetical protein